MRKSLLVYIPILAIGLLGSLAQARAQPELPPDRSVTYKIHSDTQEPESPVLITMELRMRAKTRDGDDVGWSPLWIAITQYDAVGEVVESWTEPGPWFETTLWTVTHDDPMAPQSAEFAKPPEIYGTAVSDSPNGPALDYYLLGKDATGPGPYEITSFVDYSFVRSDEPEPVDDGEDEPADVPEGDDGVS